jgi:hypothetical protein
MDDASELMKSFSFPNEVRNSRLFFWNLLKAQSCTRMVSRCIVHLPSESLVTS